jgi:hypothetical protein
LFFGSDLAIDAILGSDPLETRSRQVRGLLGGNLLENEKLEQVLEDKDLPQFQNILREQGHYDNSWESDHDPGQARLVNGESMPIQIMEENYFLTLPDGRIEPSKLPEDITNEY